MKTRILQVSALVLTLTLPGFLACSSDPNQGGGMCGGQPQTQNPGGGCPKGQHSTDGGKTCKPNPK